MACNTALKKLKAGTVNCTLSGSTGALALLRVPNTFSTPTKCKHGNVSTMTCEHVHGLGTTRLLRNLAGQQSRPWACTWLRGQW